ncbi:YraN family protein [Rhodobacter sp. KR11]|jgi:putative endonuclease|nr:YraN family protein [Rhodobacter sp. KR11]MCW1918514.1 YraN family protein [Rhodobacter sp. KR11]
MTMRSRQLRGKTNYLAGLAAEDQVSRLYDDTGRTVIARRWRGTAGEIDIIARDGDKLIFIEVKKSSTHLIASEHFTWSQQQRVRVTAEEFFFTGSFEGVEELQVDLALVDSMGRIEIVENALAA